jgi:hypothetical protein
MPTGAAVVVDDTFASSHPVFPPDVSHNHSQIGASDANPSHHYSDANPSKRTVKLLRWSLFSPSFMLILTCSEPLWTWDFDSLKDSVRSITTSLGTCHLFSLADETAASPAPQHREAEVIEETHGDGLMEFLPAKGEYDDALMFDDKAIWGLSQPPSAAFVEQFDMIWFHWRELREVPVIRRRPGTLWAFYTIESPGYSINRAEEYLSWGFQDQFNMYVSYDRHSDIRSTEYGYMKARETPLDAVPSVWASKSKLAVIIVSNTLSRFRNRKLKVRMCVDCN